MPNCVHTSLLDPAFFYPSNNSKSTWPSKNLFHQTLLLNITGEINNFVYKPDLIHFVVASSILTTTSKTLPKRYSHAYKSHNGSTTSNANTYTSSKTWDYYYQRSNSSNLGNRT